MDVFRNYPKVGIVGRMGANWNSFEFNGNQPIPDQEWPVEAQVVTGGACMMRRSLIDEIGYLDENLNPFWHEDSEYSLRARLVGYKNYIVRFGWTHLGGGHKSGFYDDSQVELLKSPNSLYSKNLKYIENKIRKENILKVFREIHKDCSESLCICTDRLVENLREMGMVVFRLPHYHTSSTSFDLHNGLTMEYMGKKIGWIHCENDRPAKDWFPADKDFDYYFPASYHTKNTLVKAGFDKEKFFNTSIDGLQDEFYFDIKPDKKPDKFTFIDFGATQPRKNTDGLIRAFTKSFTNKDNVKLVIKDYRYGYKNWTQNLIVEAKKKRDCPEIEYIYEDWSTKKLAKYLKTVSHNGAMVHPHRAESFGLPVLEALAVGLRVGTTGYGGVMDFASRVATLFPYKLVPSTFHKNNGEMYYKQCEHPMWAEPNEKEIIKWMRKVINEKYNYDWMRANSIALVKKYNFKTVAEKIKKSLDLIVKQQTTEMIFDSDYYGKDYWDGKTSSYNKYVECDVHKWDAEALMQTFGLKGKKCLDLGSCFGYQVKYLNQLGADAYGMDLSKYAVEHAYDTSKISWADLEKPLPFDDNSFDFIYSISTLEHLSYKGLDGLLKEIKRILKPKGYFFSAPGTIEQKEFYNDKSHQIQEKGEWWIKKTEVIGKSDKLKVEKFLSISKSAKIWSWIVTINQK